MITENMNGTLITCKPENLNDYRLKIAKVSKIGKPKISTKGSARQFPKDSRSLSSTDSYVRAYLRINNLCFKPDANGEPGYILSKSPTVWQSDDVEAWTEED